MISQAKVCVRSQSHRPSAPAPVPADGRSMFGRRCRSTIGQLDHATSGTRSPSSATGRRGAADDRARRGHRADRRRGPPLPRRRLLAVVQRPRPPPPRCIDQAVRDQLDRVAHSTMLGLSHPGAAELAVAAGRDRAAGPEPRLLLGLGLDGGRDRAEDGLPVLAAARRPARAPDARSSASTTAYHGDTIGSVSVGGIDLFHSAFGPLLFDAHRVEPGDIAALEELLDAPRGGDRRRDRRAAGPGRGRHPRPAARLPARGARALRPPRRPPDLRRGRRPASAARGRCSPASRRASRPTSSASPRG